MVSITASTFQTIINDASLADATAESIIDLAVHLLNLESDADLSNMSGTAGSKTLTVTSREAGAIYLVARAVYYGFYKGVGTESVANIAVTTPDLLSDSAVMRSIREAASRLKEIEVDIG